ncbi:MAG: hypothetical protein JSU00_25105 [Acidobacteria bacterium]|nr:hypothetical protein [Acidobacteriota bacterium]
MRREIRIGLLALLPCLAGADPALRFFSDPTQRISPISIAQDRRGFLWLAADEGVFRFDGYNFQKIEGDFDTPSTVAMVGPAVLAAAKNGLFAYVDGVVKKISGRHTVGITSLTNDLVLTLEIAPDFTPQLAGVSWSERGVQVHPQKPIGHWAWLSRDGWLWQRCGDRPCGVRNDANLQKAIREGEFREYVAGNRTVLDGRIPDEMGTHDVQHLLRDSAGRVYSRAFFSGVVTLLDGHQPRENFYVGNFTRGNSRPGMYEDHLGRIWIPGDFPWLMEDGKLHKVAIRQIEGQQVNCVFEDAGGRIWLGVAEKGLAVLGMGPLADVEQLSDAYGEVTSIMRAGPSSWLAATAKGILLHKESHRSWTAINENTSRPGISYVTGGRGTALGLFRLGGLVELSADGRVLHGFGTSSGIQETSLRRVIAEPDGSVLCGGKVGLCRYSGGHWTTILRPTSEFNVQDIALDSNGAGWAAIEDNVCRVVGDRCEMVLSAKNGLLGRPLSLSLGANGDLWVAYRDRGFSRFRRSGQGWSATHFENARSDRQWNTTLIRVDRRGWVWRASHDDGVWVSDGVHTDTGDWVHMSETEGLPSAVVGRYALLEDDDGSVWVGTENGIAQLRPDSSWFGGSDRPRITALSYGNRRFLEPAGFPPEFEQPGSLSIRVSGFAWLPLRYRLHPTDRDWKVSEKGELVWPGLSPGRYEVEVARGWNSEPVRFPFRIQRSVATMLKNAGVVALPIAGFAGILAAIARRRRRRKELPPLPDLTEARAEILRSESERLPGATLDGRFVLGQVSLS